MLDLSVVILAKDEELHLERCLERVKDIAKEIFLIDCFSTDRTLEIASRYPQVKVLQNKWVNYATQFNWALENAPITTQWVLRLDADEYLTDELKEELEQKLPSLTDDVTGVAFNRRHIFLGKWMRRGVYPVTLLRIFRYGKARCEQRLMDEHIELTEGSTVKMDNDFCDHNLNNLSWFCNKHVGYALREAADLLDMEYNLTGSALADEGRMINAQAKSKRMKKHKYARQPLFWRSTAYFIYRYFLKMGFLEGKEGFIWHFLQGWWYRTLVDAKVWEIKHLCNNDPERIRAYLSKELGI